MLKNPFTRIIDMVCSSLKAEDKMSSITKVELLSYSDVVKYTIDKVPKDSGVEKAVIMRQDSPRGGYIVSHFFLSADSSIANGPNGSPYGRVLWANDLDYELKQLFADKDLLVLE